MQRMAFSTTLVLATFFVFGVVGCGGDDSRTSRRATVDNLSSWLEQAGECEDVETQITRLPAPPSEVEQVAPANQRFGKQAAVAGIIACGGPNGYISYFRFPSARVRATAVRERDGLISNELFCAKGPELVINGLLGYDNTADFCKRLGFPIHQPTHVFTMSQKHRHNLEATAARLYAHSEDLPLPNIYCQSSEADLKFECRNVVGGETAAVTLRKEQGRYGIRRSVRR